MALLIAIAAIAFLSGCNDSDTGTVITPTVGSISRPAPGTVELVDAKNDISGSQDLTKAPSWLDLNWASVSKEGANLVFTMDVAGALPDKMQAGVADEWGFMLDVDQDGTSDWVIYASDTFKDGWVEGLYNPKTKERLTGQQFPGKISHLDTKVILTVSSDAIGAGSGFKWFVFTNEYTRGAENQNLQAGDHIPDLGTVDNSADWLPYP
ncbi:MAG: hypothetical protein ACYC6O_06315 [Thermoleophilia bacterium]